ncbi:helicase associated domain-containing protein [Paenibacillus sp. NRS-1783]|uniref:helicase associated domain-containing protein n=1 Tax=unclassified Paenibacillus TaxID=185978 RepID=UPI003D26E007
MYGDCNVKGDYEINGVKLGSWVSEQRTNYRRNKLSLERIKKLNLIYFRWAIANKGGLCVDR